MLKISLQSLQAFIVHCQHHDTWKQTKIRGLKHAVSAISVAFFTILKIISDPSPISVAHNHTPPTNYRDKITMLGQNKIKTSQWCSSSPAWANIFLLHHFVGDRMESRTWGAKLGLSNQANWRPIAQTVTEKRSPTVESNPTMTGQSHQHQKVSFGQIIGIY